MKPIQPQIWTNTNVETIAREIAMEAFSNVTDFELGTLKNVTTTIDYEIKDLSTPSEVLKGLLENLNLGYRVYIENKKWKFEVLTSQSKNLVLSEGMKKRNRNYIC